MADRAVLAHHVLVLEDDARPRAIVACDIRAAYKVYDLVGFDRTGARIHRVRANPRQIINLECRDRAVPFHPNPSPATMIAGVDVRVETFDAVGDELDRPPQQL